MAVTGERTPSVRPVPRRPTSYSSAVALAGACYRGRTLVITRNRPGLVDDQLSGAAVDNPQQFFADPPGASEPSGPSDSSNAASMSYSNAAATPGTAPVIRPSPITGAMASSTPVISSSVAPVASARVALHSRHTSGDPIAASAPTRTSAAVLAFKGPARRRAEPQPGLIAGGSFVRRSPACAKSR